MPTILVADDDRNITDTLRLTLTYEGYDVVTAASGLEALAKAQSEQPDLVVLDWLMPGLDGLAVARQLRRGPGPLILMLTARDGVEDRVNGLDTGADDYLVKPFKPDELLARIRALLRRSEAAIREWPLVFSDLHLDPVGGQARRGERPLNLTPREFELLVVFLRHPRQVLSREQLCQRVWGFAFEGESNFVDVAVKELRRKLELGDQPRLIQTVRGVGYALREE
jgi:two-component system response regulator MprA